MKRLLLSLALLCLLLAGCDTPRPAPSLAGTWVNVGQYSEGRDFVETMTLREDGTVTVHLEYRGADYAALEGSWSAEDGNLAVDFTDPNTRDRVYSYSLTESTLTLSGDGKNVQYTRRSQN